MRAVGSVVPALLLALACGEGHAPVEAGRSNLTAGAAARVGAELVSTATVERIVARQNVAPRQALDLAVSDALFATAARASLPRASTRTIERAAAARSLLEQLARDAAGAGGPTEAELAELARERWVEVARPAGARTTHAVVMNDKPQRDVEAHALADRLAAALSSVTSGEELIRIAKAFPKGSFQIQAEALPFVALDGRTFQRSESAFKAQAGSFDLDFARAANALQHSGELSRPVKSSFGYHVIRLDESMPAALATPQELAERLGAVALTRRVEHAHRQLLQKLRQASPVELERAVDDLTGQVQAVP